MVMVTRSSYRSASESFESSENSQRNIVAPPWCSLAKVPERKKSRKVPETWERRSVSPLRRNICEYLHEDKRKLYKRKHSRACCKQTPAGNKGRGETLISLTLLFIVAGIISWYFSTIFNTNSWLEMSAITKVVPRTSLISLLGLEQTSVEQECCSRMKYLIAELLRAEQALKNTRRLRRTMLLTSKTTDRIDKAIDSSLIEGAIVTRGKDTKEWGSRVALWGVVPLWRAAPPPDTVLAMRRPVPADCWPFSGSQGELYFELPQRRKVQCVSVEHVYPDATSSAPRDFILFGILANGTWLRTVNGEYKNRGPAKQYYPLLYQDIPFQHLVFRVLSNHGNPQYTCIYRVQLYEDGKNDSTDFP